MEIHLFIIWSKGLFKQREIISDIKRSFDILYITSINWNKDNFAKNLSRLYGQNLPKDSNKERHCGNDVFSCIVVRDNNPIYKSRKTSKGYRVVNINLFDAKQLYRSWTGGGHKIHATDNVKETKFQIMLLLGISYNYCLEIKDKKRMIYPYRHDTLIGEHGWESIESLFAALNATFQYVILRNFEILDDELNCEHPDIDLLVDDIIGVSNLLNAKKSSSKKDRVQYHVFIAGKRINFDLRFVGDNYYCRSWQEQMLSNRIKERYYYRPNLKDHYYSLLLHALFHKPTLREDYKEKLLNLKKDFNPNLNYSNIAFSNDLLDDLNHFLLENRYKITQPNDYSVYWNYRLNLKIKIVFNFRRLIFRVPFFLKRLITR